MSTEEIAVAIAGLLVAGVVKGLTGIGFSTVALPFLMLAVGARSAMALVAIPAIVSNLTVVAGAGSLAPIARRFWPFYAASVPGIVLGTLVLEHVDARIAMELLALTTLAYVGLALAKPDLALPAGAEKALKVPAGWLNGVLTGLTGSQIMPLMPYMMALRLKPAEQVQAVNLAVTSASVVLAAALLHAGIMTPELALVSAAGAVPAIAGVAAGDAMRRWLSPSAFRHMSLAALAVLALSLQGHSGTALPETCAPKPALAAMAARGSWRQAPPID